LKVFNGALYVGVGDQQAGYSVWKTDATGPLPYSLTPVVTGGAGRGATMASVVSMQVFDGRLYVGSASWYPSLYLSCEVIRIEPDDSWQVVVGNPRLTPDGLRFPISGLPDGFGNPTNFHIWRMEHHQGVLYAGTFDSAARRRSFFGRNLPSAADDGFDLYASADGEHWTTVTNDGFGNPFGFGCRSLLSTPVGLFVGSTNDAEGAGVWLATGPAPEGAVAGLAGAVVPQGEPQVAPPSRLANELAGAHYENGMTWRR
jgi:hypothetical protein